MNKKRLLDLIKSYKNNTDVQVDVFFTNGTMRKLSAMSMTSTCFITDDNTRIPNALLQKAEIYAIN